MRHGVIFDLSIPRYLLGRSIGRFSDEVLYGRASGLRLEPLGALQLPGPQWVKLETVLSGVCGTDLSNLAYRGSPALTPFASFPAVLGHEIIARVVDVGPDVSRVRVGQRVAVDPLVSCRVRGYPEREVCPACARGRPATCWRSGDEGPQLVNGHPLAPGMMVGYHRDLPGGWGDGLLAHESQLYPQEDQWLDDRAAVLVEPLSIAVHAALQAPPADSDSEVLVIGSGMIGLGAVWAVRALGHRGPVVAQVKRPSEARFARMLGASRTITPGEEARRALVASGARAYRPLTGPEVFCGGGFPVVYDCVGTRESIVQALQYVAAGGTIVLLGCTGQVQSLDLTFVWAREITVRGFLGYGTERWEDRELHTFEVTAELMRRSGAPFVEMVTVMSLPEFPKALMAAANRGESGLMKVVLSPEMEASSPAS